jgi:hypothetical protein
METHPQHPTLRLLLSSLGTCLLVLQAPLFSNTPDSIHRDSVYSSDGEVCYCSEYESFYVNSGNRNNCESDCSGVDPCVETQCCSQDCACEDDACCTVIEYVDHEPWRDGTDSGLYCLPGSTCAFSCPTKPSGAELYKYQGRLDHRYRYGSEYTPEEWRTVMMHMRVLVPMTACSYRKILSFLQERPYKPKKKPAIAKKTESTDSQGNVAVATDKELNDDELIAENTSDRDENSLGSGDNLDGLLAENGESVTEGGEVVAEDELSLEELVGPVDVEGVGFDGDVPIGGHGWIPKLNHVFSGYMYLDYTSPTNSFFRDFNGDNTFSYVFAPVFLSSYGDSLLMASKIAVFNFGQESHFVLPYAYLAYLYNDYMTFQFGKFAIPLGVYYNYYIGWCEKMATPPLARTFYEDNTIVPNVDIGVEVKGAIPLCLVSSCLNKSTLTYDFWLGNGPSEVNDFTPNNPEGPLQVPNGTIYYNAGEGNSPNNNNSLAWGGRIGFMPNDCQIYGVSYMKSRWSSNKTTFGKFGLAGGRKLNFEAAVFDWNINFNQYITFRGEYIWSQYENSVAEFPWVRNTAYWAMLSFELGLLKCYCPNVYSCNPCLWDSLEFCIRSDAMYRQPSGKSFYVGANEEGKGFDQKRFSLTLGYYFTQSFSAKLGYDFNYGDEAVYPTRAFVTDNYTKKTGFAENVFTFRIVYGW